MVRMIGGARMVGGAETALLTLDDNQAGGPGGEDKFTSAMSSAPKKFVGFPASFKAMKTIVDKFKEKRSPNKKDVKIAASEIFDIYSYSTPEARGMFDTSVPLNGFVEELGQVVSLPPNKVHYFFDSLVNLVTTLNPELLPATPVIDAQAALPNAAPAQGSGKGCGCCGGCCGGAETKGGMFRPGGVGNRGVSGQEAQEAYEARGFKTLDWASLRPKTRDYLHHLYTRLREYGSPEATLNAMVDSVTPRTAPKDLKDFFEEAAVFDDDKINKPKLKHYMTDFLKMKGLYGTGHGGAEPEKKPADANPADAKPADAKPADKTPALSAKPVSNSNVVQNVLQWIRKNKVEANPTSQSKKLLTLEQQTKKNDKENPPLISGSARHAKRKQEVPKRIQKLRERLEAEQESSDSGESESDEEMEGKGKSKGKKRAPNKRSAIVKQVMKKRGVSMIEASKIVKKEGLY